MRLLSTHLLEGLRFDGTISIGSVFMGLSFLLMAAMTWRDMDWRVKNLEIWRKEHMVDADSRNEIMQKLDTVLNHVRSRHDT